MDVTDFAARAARAAGLPDGPASQPDIDGNVNHVTVLGTGADRIVVRVAQAGQHSDFALESWCMACAAEAGLGVPEVLWLGEVDGRPVMVQRYVDGANGDSVPRLQQWRMLGEFARRIADVPLPLDAPDGLFSRFGRDLPAAWVAHVDYNLAALSSGDRLIALGVYAPGEASPLRDLLTEARALPLRFGLSHGDLSPRNLRVDRGHEPVLIDWGGAAAGPVPVTDLIHLISLRPSMGEPDGSALSEFADGWGEAIDPRALSLCRLVSTLDLVRWALERAPDRLDEMVSAGREEVSSFMSSGREGAVRRTR